MTHSSNLTQKDDEEEVCGNCGGIGYVTTMERTYPNEPHMAPIGEEPCPVCNRKEGESED